jgi:hypothetical protein
MDKKLVDELLKKMPKPTLDEVLTHPGGGAPFIVVDQQGYPVPSTPAFSFLTTLHETMPQITGDRFKGGPRGGFYTIPKFDPFQDRVTRLVSNSPGTRRLLYRAWVACLGFKGPTRVGIRLNRERVMADGGAIFHKDVFSDKATHLTIIRTPGSMDRLKHNDNE